MEIRNLMEKKLWIVDSILLIYFVYLTVFNKPYWCTARQMIMTDNCSEDIYGNNYHLWSIFPFISINTFIASTFIMTYFNIKYYIVYKNLRQNVLMFNSARKTKFALITISNFLHFTLYFLTKDNIVTFDACSIIKVLFLFIVRLVK